VKPDGDPAPVTTCVVDESSMLTEDQFASLLSALPKAARLILVGDPQQLPPIGAGRPFVDVIDHLRVDYGGSGLAELTISRRQQDNDLVSALTLPDVQLANLFSGRRVEPGEDEIIAGPSAKQSDRLKFVQWDTPQNLRDKLVEVLTEEFGTDEAGLEREIELSLGGREDAQGRIYFNLGNGAKAESWQILSANRNQLSGSVELNRFVKRVARSRRLDFARNRNQYGWRHVAPRGSDQITYGDKVICLRNHERSKWNSADGRRKGYLANGEIGLVIGGSGTGRVDATQVDFVSQAGESYSFWKTDFAEEASPFLELAYSVTVHKAQGSEFETVILVLPGNSRLLTREMLYTALTRQKKSVWILHQGPFAKFHRLQSDFFSETKRRTTNLFAEPKMYEASVDQPGGTQKRWLAGNLIHATRGGTLVRSKSELIIADMLEDRRAAGDLRYSYEQELTNSRGEARLPDFTIDTDDGTWYWEHCGMMGSPQYVERWKRKLAWYEDQGITPWSPKNPSGRLIVTQDDPQGGIDSKKIFDLITALFNPNA
jgi:ATP-dependent exoDNAse (exonuclease V) alpha subunit